MTQLPLRSNHSQPQGVAEVTGPVQRVGGVPMRLMRLVLLALPLAVQATGLPGGPAANPAPVTSPAAPTSLAGPAEGTGLQADPSLGLRTGAALGLRPITEADANSSTVIALEVPPDLWDRIRRRLTMRELEGDLVRNHEQWYLNRPDYIRRMTERSRKYLFHIVEELEKRNMPAELALLPFIESAFNPQAVSSAKAAGMWQFMPATGVDFELRQNLFRDDRRDVLASTRAALEYLQKLHEMFGDWHLALAAYNWGQGNVQRAIQRNKRMGLPTGYEDLNMPAETRNYVPKLQAVKNIVANPDKLGADLPLIGNHPYFQTVTITRDIDVELIARLADVRLEDFKALNPSYNRPVILAAGTPQVLLPWDNATLFERNLEGHQSGRYASWTAWVAPATMTVAEAARRVGMGEADFRNLNNIPPRMLIRRGSTLMAPRGDRQANDVTASVADNAQLSLSPEVVLRRVTVKAGKKDSVATIAARYKVKPADVARWNEVATNAKFNPGDKVALELPARQGKTARASGTAASGKAHTDRPTQAKATAKAQAKATAKAQAKAPVKVAERNTR